ncbi:MAG: hypothetical protein IPL78_07755, partial [Chloroflexi bacterium]|nr:hypothetical protein [Chloroflexota bacterium]
HALVVNPFLTTMFPSLTFHPLLGLERFHHFLHPHIWELVNLAARSRNGLDRSDEQLTALLLIAGLTMANVLLFVLAPFTHNDPLFWQGLS